MTHYEHSHKMGKLDSCTAHTITFGGRCLVCGYDPQKAECLYPLCEQCQAVRSPYLICLQCRLSNKNRRTWPNNPELRKEKREAV